MNCPECDGENESCENCVIGDGSPYPCSIFNAAASLIDCCDVMTLYPRNFKCSFHTRKEDVDEVTKTKEAECTPRGK